MDKIKKALLSEIMSELGRKGGKIGGKRSLETMTPEERSARARKASLAAVKKRRLTEDAKSVRTKKRAKTN